MSSAEKQRYEFGPFRLDAAERVLLRDGEVVRLTPKEFETLLALVRGRGRVRSKRELLEEVWPGTYVEEATLAQNVFTLRKALARGDGEGDGPQYIETVPRRGYRLAAEVRELTDEPAAPGGPKEEAGASSSAHEALRTTGDGRAPAVDSTEIAPAPPPPAPQIEGHPRRAAVLITLGVLAAVSLLVYVVFRFSVRPHTTPPPRPPAFQAMKVTRLPVAGAVREAAISPDGAYLAYVADEPGATRGGVWVRQVAAASNNQQLAAPAEGVQYGGVTFSPDAQHVYFLAFKGPDGNATLYQVPVFGGTAKKILEAGNGPVSLSPDGRRVAYITGRFGEEMALMLAELSGGSPRRLVARTPPHIFGLPVWSPDGKWVACVYGSAEDPDSETPLVGFTAFNAGDGSETQVTDRRWYGAEGMAWLPDSSALLVNTAEAELSPSQIWQLPFPSGEPRRVTNDLSTYIGTSVTRDGSALVTVQTDRVPNVWVAPGGDAARARQVTTGAGKFDGFYGLAWAPDGRVVYSSVAGGNWDIWVMNSDGTGQRQLTVGARSNYGPSVSPDGRHIYFVSNRAGGPFHIWRMDADGSNPKQLTSQRGENFPHATPDGRWVVYATIGFGKDAAVWKVPAEGGEPVRLTDKPASWPFLSPDGKWFVCTYGAGQPMNSTKLAVISVDGGEPVRLYDTPPTFRANTVWLPDNRGIAYLDNRTGVSNVWMQPMSGGKPVQLTDFKTDGVTAHDWSRDNRLAASRSVETTGVVLIKDFK